MTKQCAIASRDHGAGIPEQGFDGVARGGCLPVVALKRADAEYDLGNLLLRCAVAMTVKGLQHSSQTRALLPRQALVRRNGPAVEGREQAIDGLKPIEPLDAEGNEGGGGRIGGQCARAHQLDALAVTEIMEKKGFGAVAGGDRAIQRWTRISVRTQSWGRLCEDDGAGIVLREPEDVSCRRCVQRIDREIATPTAAGSRPSADVHHSWHSSALGNPCRRIRCGAAIPTRDRMRSGLRHVRSRRANASRTHPVSSRTPLALELVGESGFPVELFEGS